jgi:beta-glucosidase
MVFEKCKPIHKCIALFIVIPITIFVFYFQVEGKSMSLKKYKFSQLSYKKADSKADSVLAMMSVDEKIAIITGDRSFFIKPIPRLNLPEVYMTDATQGVHIRETFEDNDLTKYQLEKSTAFPCPISLAATWNPEASYCYAEAVGEECRAGGIGVLLGPGVNNYRISQCGRNFEYFGEDPFLRARMVSEYVKGMQSTGTIATLKHFVANNTDYYRRKSNSIVDERTLHEIYLPPFKAGIDAGAQAVMTAYNLLNGEWCSQSEYVINGILKTQLGFRGLVMTDWWAVNDGEKLVKSGQDLEMPNAVALKDARHLLQDGKILIKDIDRMVKSILRTCFIMKFDSRKKYLPDSTFYKNHESAALQVAREGIVLLKNENILPLSKNKKNILVTGDYIEKIAMGGGSAKVKGYNNRVLLDELRKEFGPRITYVMNPSTEQARSADVILCAIGTEDNEGWDRPFELNDDQEKKVNDCVNNNPNTVVIVCSGSGVRMTDWNDKAGAILYGWYGGQIGNKALAEIIAGKTNPSGKLPITIEKEFKDSPGYGYLPKGETLYQGWNEKEEKEHPVYDVRYNEGIFAGYRWYEKKNIEPLYPFGFGLSYTSFKYSSLSIKTDMFLKQGKIKVGLTVKNIGNRKGLETVQLYIQDEECTFPRPIKELKGFAKVDLKPGQSKKVVIELTKNDFSFWNPKIKDWFFEKGAFVIHIGSSSKNIHITKRIEL